MSPFSCNSLIALRASPPVILRRSEKKETAPKASKIAAATSGKSGKKKKWSKGKAREKLNNLVLFDKPTYEKLYKEVPAYKFISASIISERLKITGGLARKAIKELQEKGLIRAVISHSAQTVYTRATKEEAK